NLLGNAIKFTHSGEVRAAVTRTVRGVEIAVQDSGIGMTADEIPAVFDKFWRSGSVSGLGGTGLGLSITRSLVERMGGLIEVESVVGEGSTFRVVLPLEEQPSSPPLDLPQPIPRLLLGLRHPAVRSCAERNLQARGFHVETVVDATAASSRLRGVDLVVVELADPGAADLVKQARRHGASILGVSPLGATSHALALQVDGVALEPIGPARLLTLVEALTHVPMSEESTTGSLYLRTEHARAQRVLVVEDHPDNRNITVHALQRAGYEVVAAHDGAEAVQAARRSGFDLILSDVAMTEMDGLEATQRIRAEERVHGWSRVPIVALTAHATLGFRERCLEAGMDDYATKPLRRGQLLDLVARWIDPRPKVLVVDDSPDSRELLRRFLDKDGRFAVRVADGGEAALASFQRSAPDLVLLDMEMPGMDGLRTALRLRELDQASLVPILAVTGHTGAVWRRRCQDAGCDAMLEKPIRRDALVKSVATLLSMPAVAQCRAS
ncbi:MAG: response regulator, partial [Myxococcales bacterium]|nr:response regulator [Myxococcales bacterium]